MRKFNVLFAGESWFFTTTETKGFDQFTIGGYETEIGRVRAYMEEYADITHIPAHLVATEFPDSAEKLKEYDAVLVSDVGANSFLLHPDTFQRSIRTPDKLKAIAEYVEQGGAFGMIGGYMTFMGIEGKGRYHGTVIEEILPVTMMQTDDRREHPEGITVTACQDPLADGLPSPWPYLLGYNKLSAKDGARVIAQYEGDPILALGTYGNGRTFAWASDCAPHWMPAAFCESDLNKELWRRVLTWAVGE
ncbi:glutamine amidotransferase [Diplocloster modestus]|uniref:Glutamine amidotransferase n=1 Tax=Diplocloster modestus TaxID=2850322 RepID=A0ABS6KCL2_9FIRM|nr:glutamine amidotransferase [Diplocloster modestus]MBU9728253.1 glutamine amidotransferase [Diplocloster modestus]